MKVKQLVRGTLPVFLGIFFFASVISGFAQVRQRPNEVNQGEFAIFLPKGKRNWDLIRKQDLQMVELPAKPVLSTRDVVYYFKKSHEFQMTPEGFKQLMGTRDLDFPFVVCVGKERIYGGAVFSDILSSSYPGIVILKHTFVPETSKRHFPDQAGHQKWKKSVQEWKVQNTIKLDLGYPSPDFFKARDLRNDSRILEVLKKVGKLKD